jgi:hypothetical protein
MICLHTDYLHIEYYSAHSVLISQWYGRCSSLQYRRALIQSIRLCRELAIKYAVLDYRLLPALPEEDQKWTTNIFLKAFTHLPFKRIAVVSSFDSEAEAQLQQFLHDKRFPLLFEARTFEDLTSAYDWLTLQKAS